MSPHIKQTCPVLREFFYGGRPISGVCVWGGGVPANPGTAAPYPRSEKHSPIPFSNARTKHFLVSFSKFEED